MSPQRNRCQMGSHQRTERAGNEVFSSEFLLLPAEAWLQCQPKNVPFCLSHSGWDFLSLRRMGAQSEVLGFACTWEFYRAALEPGPAHSEAAGDQDLCAHRGSSVPRTCHTHSHSAHCLPSLTAGSPVSEISAE